MSPQHRDDQHPETPKGIHPEEPGEKFEPRFNKWWVGGWLSPILVAGGTILWSLLIWFLIRDRVRDWQYGTVPYVPGESITAVERLPRTTPNQVVLPERPAGGLNARP